LQKIFLLPNPIICHAAKRSFECFHGRRRRTEANSILALYKGGVTDNLPCVSNQAKVLAGIDSDEKGEFLIVRNA